MKKFRVILSILLVLAAVTAATAGVPAVFNVKDYGAAGDGAALDHPAINKAIKECNASGGGTVYFPPGTYLSGSIRLKSNVTLYIDAGATILGASNDILDAYDPPEKMPFKEYQDFGHSHWHNSLIWGENLVNIAITGTGTINGGGMRRYESRNDPKPSTGGDKAIALKSCKSILIKDIKIEHAGHFAILATGCDNMIIDSVMIDTNRDGINLDCCNNVRISNCTINSPSDDALCPKSSYALGFKRPCENITITNCYVSGYDDGDFLRGQRILEADKGRTGRIKLGTESNGGFKNFTISNCVFERCNGFALELVDGGIMENINISNITMRDLTECPIFIRLGNRARGPYNPPVGVIRNINISNITATVSTTGRFASIISGIPGHPIEDVSLNNIRIVYKGGGTEKDAERVVPENERGYPEPTMFGDMPAYGFYCRHIKGLEFHNVKISFKDKELRPAIICEDVEGLEIDSFKAERAPGNDSPIVLKNVKDAFVHSSRDFPVIDAAYEQMKLSKNKVSADEPFSLTVKATATKSGLSKTELFIDSELFATEYVWLNANEPRTIAFSNLKLYTAGSREVRIGDAAEMLEAEVHIEPVKGRFKYSNPSAVTPVTRKGIASTIPMADENSVIKVKVQNVGGYTHRENVSLNVNNKEIGRMYIGLKGGEEKEIQFKHTFPESGNYEIAIGNLTRNVYVWNGPGKFVCKGLKVSTGSESSTEETPVTAGEPFTVSASITDTEYGPKFYSQEGGKIDLYVNGKLTDWEFALAKKGEEKTVNFELTPHKTGKHTISVGKSVVIVTVEPKRGR